MMINFDLEMQRIIENVPKGEPVLLHACCGPCSSSVLERLAPHLSAGVFYYNPCIQPEAEYEKRKQALEGLLDAMPLEHPAHLLQNGYDGDLFAQTAKGLEAEPEGGARCTECFAQRLSAAAARAKQEGYGWFATTLTVSPHKNAPLINEIGQRMAERHGLRFLPSDFKKRGGYQRSIELSRTYGLYRQDYCGCLFSK